MITILNSMQSLGWYEVALLPVCGKHFHLRRAWGNKSLCCTVSLYVNMKMVAYMSFTLSHNNISLWSSNMTFIDQFMFLMSCWGSVCIHVNPSGKCRIRFVKGKFHNILLFKRDVKKKKDALLLFLLWRKNINCFYLCIFCNWLSLSTSNIH